MAKGGYDNCLLNPTGVNTGGGEELFTGVQRGREKWEQNIFFKGQRTFVSTQVGEKNPDVCFCLCIDTTWLQLYNYKQGKRTMFGDCNDRNRNEHFLILGSDSSKHVLKGYLEGLHWVIKQKFDRNGGGGRVGRKEQGERNWIITIPKKGSANKNIKHQRQFRELICSEIPSCLKLMCFSAYDSI